MQLFEKLAEYRYEQLVFCHDKATGLRAVVAIHDTTLGPALGGCRMYPYTTEEDALVDVLRLARGMTYKAAPPPVFPTGSMGLRDNSTLISSQPFLKAGNSNGASATMTASLTLSKSSPMPRSSGRTRSPLPLVAVPRSPKAGPTVAVEVPSEPVSYEGRRLSTFSCGVNAGPPFTPTR